MLALGVPPSTVVMAPVPPTVVNTSALWVRGARRRTGSRRPRCASQTSYPSRTSPASTMPPRSTAPCTSRPRSTPRRPTRRTRFSPRPGSSSAAPPSGRSPPAGSHSRSSRCCWPSLRRRIQTLLRRHRTLHLLRHHPGRWRRGVRPPVHLQRLGGLGPQQLRLRLPRPEAGQP